MKKYILLICALFIVSCSSNNKDAIKFKNEYEKADVNLTENVEVKVSKDNPFVYSSSKEIKQMKNDKKTFVTFYGNEKNMNARILVPILIDTAKEMEIEKIYYVKDDKDIKVPLLEVVVDGKVSSTTNGTSDEKSLLDMKKEDIKDNLVETLKESVSLTCDSEPSC